MDVQNEIALRISKKYIEFAAIQMVLKQRFRPPSPGTSTQSVTAEVFSTTERLTEHKEIASIFITYEFAANAAAFNVVFCYFKFFKFLQVSSLALTILGRDRLEVSWCRVLLGGQRKVIQCILYSNYRHFSKSVVLIRNAAGFCPQLCTLGPKVCYRLCMKRNIVRVFDTI